MGGIKAGAALGGGLMMRSYVAGLGLFTAGFTSVSSWASGARDTSKTGPASAPRSLGSRDAAQLTRIAAEALGQAAAAGGVDPRTVTTLYALADGEARGSVVAGALLEALKVLSTSATEVLLVAAGEPPPSAFGAPPPLAVAFLLTRDPQRDKSIGMIGNLRREAGALCAPLPPGYAENPCASALALLDALVRRRPSVIALERGELAPLCVDVECEGAVPSRSPFAHARVG